ncbi:DUF5723 family protein [Wenyingzhuangia sp. IMCC45467]
MKNYTKLIAVIAFTVLGYNSVKAQSEISFFHLGDYVQQSTDVSPVYIPKNSFSFALPSIGLAVGNGFAASDLLTEVPGTERLEYNFKNVYSSLDGDYNQLNQKVTLNVLNLAFKRKHGSLSFFVNMKENVGWNISKNGIVNLLANGVQDEVLINDEINSTAYAEGGVGFTQQFLNDKLAVGVRVKYIIGLANGSTKEDGFAKINVNDDLTWTINTQNAITRVAGYKDGEDYEFSTANSGIGFDIGASYEIIPNLTVEVAVNDIGSITWKEKITEYYLNDVTNLIVDGVDLDTDEDILEELGDKLADDVGADEREGESYKTSLATNSYFSASYKLSGIHNIRFTMFNDLVNSDQDATLALGYNVDLDKSTYGIVGIKNAQGNLDLGLNFAAKLGPLQLFLATSRLNEILGNPKDIKNVNLRFGLNFVFGYNKWL